MAALCESLAAVTVWDAGNLGKQGKDKVEKWNSVPGRLSPFPPSGPGLGLPSLPFRQFFEPWLVSQQSQLPIGRKFFAESRFYLGGLFEKV